MYVCVPYAWQVCTMFMWGALGGQKKASDPRGLKLPRLGTTPWVLGTERRSSARTSALNR